jgi:predicted RecB family nuclease
VDRQGAQAVGVEWRIKHQQTMYIVLSSSFQQFEQCERHLWLNQHGDTQLKNPVDGAAQRSFAFGVDHEALIQRETLPDGIRLIPVYARTWDERVQATLQAMREGASLIQHGCLEANVPLENGETVQLRGEIDRLKRVQQPSRFGRWAYMPIEIKSYHTLKLPDLLQLDSYLYLLQQAQDELVNGEFWLGRDDEGQPLKILGHSLDENRLLNAVNQITETVRQPASPAIRLASHCKICPWYQHCTAQARNSKSIGLLSELPKSAWQQMLLQGITTIEQVAALSHEDLLEFNGIGKTKAASIIQQAQSLHHDQPVWKQPLPEPCRMPGLMLDLETRFDNMRPWCFGWQDVNGQSQAAVVAAYFQGDILKLPDGQQIHIVPDSDTGWEMVADAAEQVDGHVFHWTNFEQGILQSSAPSRVIARLLPRMHDLNRLFKQTVSIPVRGTSIKTVAPYLGFEWPEGTNAMQAWSDYQRWLLNNDRDALARACAYNRADVEAMTVIWRWLLQHS